jgi:hypothetical protein
MHVEFSPNFSLPQCPKLLLWICTACLHIFGCIQILEHLAHTHINKAYFWIHTTIKTCQFCVLKNMVLRKKTYLQKMWWWLLARATLYSLNPIVDWLDLLDCSSQHDVMSSHCCFFFCQIIQLMHLFCC